HLEQLDAVPAPRQSERAFRAGQAGADDLDLHSLSVVRWSLSVGRCPLSVDRLVRFTSSPRRSTENGQRPTTNGERTTTSSTARCSVPLLPDRGGSRRTSLRTG